MALYKCNYKKTVLKYYKYYYNIILICNVIYILIAKEKCH